MERQATKRRRVVEALLKRASSPSRPEIGVKILTMGVKAKTKGARLLQMFPALEVCDVRKHLGSDEYETRGGQPGTEQGTRDRIRRTVGCEDLVFAITGALLTTKKPSIVLHCSAGKHRAPAVGVLVQEALLRGYERGLHNVRTVEIWHLELDGHTSSKDLDVVHNWLGLDVVID
jgi:hypothetical protein